MQDIVFADWQMWATLFLIGVIIVLYTLDRFSMELVSAGAVVALLLFFHFFPVADSSGDNVLDAGQILSGFASPALFAILGLLIIGQGMFQSGALEFPTRMLVNAYDRHHIAVFIALFALIIIISAFLNNTPVVVMFIPIMAAIAAQSKMAPSRLMIPLSFMSIFGGMITLIGSSTNLLAAESFTNVTGESIGFFALAPIGVALTAIGAVYLMVAGRWLLPDRTSQNVRGGASEGKQFIAQIEINRGHPLIGRGAVAGLFPDLPDMTVRMVQRREQAMLPPYDDFVFRLHDTVIIAATRKSLTNLLRAKPDILSGVMSEIVLDRLNGDASYRRMFAAAFPETGGIIDFRSIRLAIAAFERTLISAGSPYDAWLADPGTAIEISLRESPCNGVRGITSRHRAESRASSTRSGSPGRSMISSEHDSG